MKNLRFLKLIIFITISISLLVTFIQFSPHQTSAPIIKAALLEENDPLLLKGKSKVIPWSGWWWPFYVELPPNLYNPGGPMDKYDQVSVARGKANPGTMAWESLNHFTNNAFQNWFGHCNGWAAAAVLEPQPKQERVISGVKFKINDLMGLLSEWHWWDQASAFYGTRYDDQLDDINDVYPHEFHRSIIYFIGKQNLPIIIDISGGNKEKYAPQVWNFPAYQYKMEYRSDSENSEKVHVHCQLWFSDFTHPDSPKDQTFVMDYYYWIKGEKGNPTSGGWETAKEGGWGSKGDSVEDHPDFLWYPAKAKQHPILKQEQFLEILGQGEIR